MRYWLFKSEPNAYSIDDLARDKREWWDGVRNYQARNFMRDDMRCGDGVLFYHSSCAAPGVVGEARVDALARPDVTQFDAKSPYYDAAATADKPRWWYVRVAFAAKYPRVVTLTELRADKHLSAMRLLSRGNRLSVMPVEAAEWKHIRALVTRPPWNG